MPRPTTIVASLAASLLSTGRATAEAPETAAVVESRGFLGKDGGFGHITAVPSAKLWLTLSSMRLTAAADLVLDRGDGTSSFAWTSPYVGVASNAFNAFGELELGTTIPVGAHDVDQAAALGLGTKLLGGDGFPRFRTNELAVLVTHRSAFGHYPLHFASEVSLGAAIPIRDAGEFGVPLQASLDATWQFATLALGLRTTMTAAFGSQDPHLAATPTLQVPVGSVRLGVCATLNLGGALGSTFTGAPWSLGFSLELPAQANARGRLDQCDHDSDCANGYECQIAASCDECEGGPMRCVKRQ